MRILKLLSLPALLLLGSCATPVPVAVPCPPLPQAPQSLSLPVSTEPSLSKRYDDLTKEFQDSLTKATRTP